MTTHYPSTQTYITPPGSQIHLYGGSQLSPVNSASGTPTDVSPTSPRSHNMLSNVPLATKQLRPPKSPMYIPAVLRPTERPRPGPLTPPRSVHGSWDSLEEAERPASRRSTVDNRTRGLGRVVEDEVATDENWAKVTGLPTRKHWKPDANASICDAPICPKSFNLFERRHHCRHCGHIFCNTHSHYTIPLDEDAEFHPDGFESRACKHCWDQYCRWRMARRSRSNSVMSAATPTMSTPVTRAGRAEGSPTAETATRQGSISSSVPQNWNWSTF